MGRIPKKAVQEWRKCGILELICEEPVPERGETAVRPGGRQDSPAVREEKESVAWQER